MPKPKIVLAHGCWDLVHPGHLEHLQQARAMGDRLVVSITSDQYVNKGPGRPIFPEGQRAAFLSALRCVDHVYICHTEDALPAIKRYRPQIYVKGAEYAERIDGKFATERAAVESYGGAVAFTDGFVTSSSQLINNHLQRDSAFQDLRAHTSYEQVNHWLAQAGQVKALVLGESITDVYNYVSPGWKSAKENTIDYIFEDSVTFAGGADIVAAHARGFCKSVLFDSLKHWPITKTRYIDRDFGQKLYSVIAPRTVEPYAGSVLSEYPLVIVADFGHGLFPQDVAIRIRDTILEQKQFLALTVQSNGTNWGFNLYDKWPGCDYLVLDHMELRLACRSLDRDLIPLVRQAANKSGAQTVAITLGHNGCLIYRPEDDELFQLPVLTDKVVDRIGAGDAFLAATAPLAYLGAPLEVIAAVGNAAGAIQVGIKGNARGITRSDVERIIKGILL